MRDGAVKLWEEKDYWLRALHGSAKYLQQLQILHVSPSKRGWRMLLCKGQSKISPLSWTYIWEFSFNDKRGRFIVSKHLSDKYFIRNNWFSPPIFFIFYFIFFYIDKSRFLFKFVLVPLSASVERVVVSRMRDFSILQQYLLLKRKKICSKTWNLHQLEFGKYQDKFFVSKMNFSHFRQWICYRFRNSIKMGVVHLFLIESVLTFIGNKDCLELIDFFKR